MTDTTLVTTASHENDATTAGSADGPSIERRIHLRAAPDRVWNALTSESELSAWFGSGARLEPRAGAQLRCGDDRAAEGARNHAADDRLVAGSAKDS